MIVTYLYYPYGGYFVVRDVLIDVYVTPFLCACSDQTSILGLVRGMCLLGGVIL
jgi:hypothetical protein